MRCGRDGPLRIYDNFFLRIYIHYMPRERTQYRVMGPTSRHEVPYFAGSGCIYSRVRGLNYEVIVPLPQIKELDMQDYGAYISQ